MANPQDPLLGQMTEVAAALRAFADDLDDQDQLQALITNIARESISGRQYRMLTDSIRYFVNTLAFTIGLPIEAIKKLLRIFLVMWNHPSIAKYVLENVYQEPLDEGSSVDLIPHEITGIGPGSFDIYLKALKEGQEKVQNIRLMVVGMFAVGKTSMVNNLIEDFRIKEKQDVKSTEHVDVHKCKIENGKWVIDDPGYAERLKDIVKKVKLEEQTLTIENDLMQVEMHDVTDSVDPQPDVKVLYDRKQQDPDQQDIEQDSTSKKEVLVQDYQESEDVIVKDFLGDVLTAENEPVPAPYFGQENIPPQRNRVTLPTVSVWDFAGQNIYYSTHHFFLNKRSVYLLLMDLTMELDSTVEHATNFSGVTNESFTCLDSFKFWLNSINMYSSMNDREQNVKPTVILIGTHKDKLKDMTEDEKEKFKENYFNKALASFVDTPILKHIHRKKFLVNNSDADSPVFDDIKDAVVELAREQYYWDENVPARWIEMERSLDSLRNEDVQMLTLERVREVNQRITYPIGDDQLELFLTFQHMLGNILYFPNDEDLKQLVILKPFWIIEAFKCFINHVPNQIPIHVGLWKDYKEKAILKPELIDELMEEAPESVKCHKEEVIKYMEYLDVIAKPIRLEEVDTRRTEVQIDVHTSEESHEKDALVVRLNPKMLDFHIVPCLLKEMPPMETLKKLICPMDSKNTPVLCYVFKDNFMPPSVFHRLLAICIRAWEIVEQEDKYQIYNGMAVFDSGETSYLTLWYNAHIIYCRMSVVSKATNALDGIKSEVLHMRNFLKNALMEILDVLPRSNKTVHIRPFEEWIQCDHDEFAQCGNIKRHNPGLFRIREFMFHREMKCNVHSTKHPIDREFALGTWFPDMMEAVNESESCQLQRSPEERELVDLARPIAQQYEYWLLGIELGINQARMEQLWRDHEHMGVNTFVFHMLLEWRNIEKKDTYTFHRLRLAMIAVNPDVRCFDADFMPRL